MLRVLKFLAVFFLVLVMLGVCAVFMRLVSLYVLLVLLLIYGWIVYLFFHYRYIRQEEFLHLLTAATEAGVPLVPALWAYVHDRPRDPSREFWIAAAQTAVLPGYYWLYHRRHCYEAKVRQVAAYLEAGHSLHRALQDTPGVASRETMLAAAVGESTGKLNECLRSAPRWRMAPVWLAATPRLFYPLILLLVINAILAFLTVFIIPRYERIFQDFGLRLPEATEWVIALGRTLVRHTGWIAILVIGFIGLVVALFFSSTICWHLPVFGRLYRMNSQGRFLKMLALLLQAGKTVSESLWVLEHSGYFGNAVRRRVTAARLAVGHGEPLGESLQQYGLLPESMTGLVAAAQRAGNLPWALGEMGETLGNRVVRKTQRVTLMIFPLAILATGAVVGFIVYGVFIPLLALMEGVGT